MAAGDLPPGYSPVRSRSLEELRLVVVHRGSFLMLRENRRGDYLMKRKMLMRMLAAALSASLLVGCGNTAKPADSGSAVTAGEERSAGR